MKVWQVTCVAAPPVPKGKRDAEPTKVSKETTPRCIAEKSGTRRRVSSRIPPSALFACCFCLCTWTFRFFARAHCRSVLLRFRLPDGRREKLVYPFVLQTNLRKKKKKKTKIANFTKRVKTRRSKLRTAEDDEGCIFLR